MRILITNTGSWGTGSFVAVNALTKEFHKLGHKVKIFFPDMGLNSSDKDDYYNNPELYSIWRFPIAKDDVQIPTFPLMIPDPHPRTPNILTFKELSEAQLELYFADFKENIKKIITEFQPNVIECEHIWAMAYVLSELNLPYFVTAHHSDQMGFRFDERMQIITKQAAQHAKYVFTISNHVKNEILELYNVPENKIIVSPNGYDKTVFTRKSVNRQKFLAELGANIPQQANIITFAGKISYTKGVDIILKANQILNNPNIHFLMFGAGHIEDISKTTSFNNLHFVGHQIPEIISKAHNIAKLSIMPSRAEGFGITGLEAMGCGLPIIVTQNTEPENFAIGKIIEQENPKQLAEAILEILNLSEDKYQKLSGKAQHRAQQFSWESVAKIRLQYFARLPASNAVDSYNQ
jgi:glycosyltransferase involved in cell wall biosynthesis